MTTETGTRKSLGIEYGDRITVQTRFRGLVTGTVARDDNGWKLVDRDIEGHLPPFGNATRITVLR